MIKNIDLHEAQYDILMDPHRFKVVCAGRRWGKSTLALAMAIKAMVDKPNAITAIVAPCYDENTQILTNNGWKYFKDLTKTDLVGTYTTRPTGTPFADGYLSFERPSEYFTYDYDGQMIGIDNATIDMLVTPHHRCLVKNHRKGDWHVRKAEDIAGRWVYKFKKDCDWVGERYDKNWARFWGWYVSEGSARKRWVKGYEIVITQQKKEFFDDIRRTLTSCGLEFKEDRRVKGINFRISQNKELTEKCLSLGKSKDKFVPKEILNADKKTIKEFLESYWNGDGHYPKDSYDYKRAETQSKQLADDIQELIIKLGYSANVRKINGRELYSVSWLNKKYSTPLIKKSDYYKTNYTGKVYCVKVKSGIVMVRRNGKHYWSGNTYQQAKDIYWRDPMKLTHYISADSIAKKNDSELFLQFKNGSYLYLRGSDRPDTLRGLRFDFVVLDEFAQMKSNIWEQIIQPTLLDSKGSAIFISTPYGYDKFYKLWMKGQKDDKEWKSWRFTSYENPHNDPKDLNKWREENDEDTFAQEYLAEFKKLKGLVYKDFSPGIHIIEPKDIPLTWSLYRGIDFGYVNPTAILFIAVSPDGEIIVFDEIYMSGLRTPDIADLIKQRSTGRGFVNTIADSAQRSDIEELQKYGIAVYGVSKSTGSRNEDYVTYKIRRVAEKLKQKKLFIFKTCTNLIFEFQNYKYHEVKEEERVKEIPLKVNDHALDALSYLVTSLPERIDPQILPWDEEAPEEKEADWSFT